MATSCFIPKVWHAFEALTELNYPHRVSRTKCRVLIHNLSSIFHLNIIEDFNQVFPEDDEKTKHGITFEEYENFLASRVLTRLPTESTGTIEEMSRSTDDVTADGKSSKRSSTMKPQTAPHSAASQQLDAVKQWQAVDEACWVIYRNRFFTSLPPNITPKAAFALWKIFNMFAATAEQSGVIRIPVVMDADEFHYWLVRLFDILILNVETPTSLSEDAKLLTYPEAFSKLLNLLEKTEENGTKLTATDIENAISEVEESTLDGILMKGYLFKDRKNQKGSQWKNRWCELSHKSFTYYTDQEKKEKKGEHLIKLGTSVETCPNDRAGGKGLRFQVAFDDDAYLIETTDMQTRSKWVKAFQTAISLRGVEKASVREARIRAEQRVGVRSGLRLERQLREEELENEKKMRCRLAEQLSAEQSKLNKEHERLLHLDELTASLERALQEEKKAKEDEMIVRTMTAKLLEEETASRRKVEERLQSNQEMLNEEKAKRTGLEQMLKIEQERVEQINADKSQLHKRLEISAADIIDQKEMNDQAKEARCALEEHITRLDARTKSLETECAYLKGELKKESDLFKSEKKERARLEEQLKQQDDIFSSEVDKRANLELELTDKRTRCQRLVEENRKLQEHIKDLQVAMNGEPPEIDTTTIPDNLADQVLKSSNAPVDHTAPEQATSGKWSSLFSRSKP